MTHSHPVSPEQVELLLILQKDGWDIHWEDLSIVMIVMLGTNEGIAFNIFVDSWTDTVGRLFMDEFHRVDGEYISDQEYPSQDIELSKLADLVAPYIARGYDWANVA